MAETKTDDTRTGENTSDDGDLVERELLVDGMYLEHRDRKRGDVVSLPADVAERLENLSPPAVAEVGTIEKMEQERAEAEEETQRLREEVRDREFEIARRRKEHHENRLAGDTDDKTDDGETGDEDDDTGKDTAKGKASTSSSSSSSGRPNQSANDGPTVTKRAGSNNPGGSTRRS